MHKPSHFKESFSLIINFCKEKNLPCRNFDLSLVDVVKTSNKVINGTDIIIDELKMAVENFKDGESYEILFHPGMYDPDCKSSLNKEREVDVRKIEEINLLLEKNNIGLISYIDFNVPIGNK